MKIIELTQNDWQVYKNIRLEALKTEPDSFLATYEEEVSLPDKYWVNVLESNKIFGCFIENKLVSILGLTLEKKLKISHTATIWGMYNTKQYRGLGVSYGMIDYVKNYVKPNVTQLHLGCNAENIAAVKLYRKCGFKIYGTRPSYTKIGDKFCDDLIMICEI